MTARIQTFRSSTTGTRPSTTRPVGELFVNLADNALGVMDATPAARDLLPIRYHAATAAYATNDIVRQGAGLYQAKAAIPAHAFNASEWNQFLTGQVGYAIGNIPGPIVSQGGISALKPPAELIFQRNAFAATDGQDFRFRRVTTFTGGTFSNINKCLEVEFANTAGNGCQEWPFLVKAMNSSTSGGMLVSAYIQAWRNAGNGLTTGLITDVADFQGTPSSTSGQLTGMEWDLNATGADDGTNGGRFGGVGIRQMVHAVFANMSSTINSEYTAGIWFGTGINGTASAYVDSLLCVQGGAGQPTLIRNFLDSRGAAPPPGVTDPVAAVRMSAGHIIDFAGGPALNSAPGNYLQYTTAGTPRLRYMVGANERLNINDAGVAQVAGGVSIGGLGVFGTNAAQFSMLTGTHLSGAGISPFNLNLNADGTLTSGTSYAFANIGVNGDSVQAGTGPGGLSYLTVSGVTSAGLGGTRVGIQGRVNVTTTTGNTGGQGGMYVGGAFYAIGTVNDNGVSGVGGSRGSLMALNTIVHTVPGATYYSGICSAEFDVNSEGPGISYREGIKIVLGGKDNYRGALADYAIAFGQNEDASGLRPGWANGITFVSPLAVSPWRSDSQLIGTLQDIHGGTAFVADRGVDFRNFTFTTAFLMSKGFQVDGAGKVSAAALAVTGATTVNTLTASAGVSAQSVTATGAVNAQSVTATGTVTGQTLHANQDLTVDRNVAVTGGLGVTGSITAGVNISAIAGVFAENGNIVIGPGGAGRIMQMQAGCYFDFGTGTTDMIWTNNNVQVWVMRGSDGAVYNNVNWVGGHGAYRDVSDERLKTDITPATVGLPEILAIDPINFHRLSPDGQTYPEEEIGFSAQNVQPIIPEAVTVTGIGLPDALAVASEMILAAAVNAIKTLNDRVVALEAT